VLKSKGFSVAILSGIGILATFLFQVATARLLSPSEYGLVAAYLAIVNIAAIGAGALQNAVTVQVAKQINGPRPSSSSQYSTVIRRLFSTFDATTIEAAVLGFSGAILLLIFFKPLSQELHTAPVILVAAAATIPISFFISRDLGILQGKELTVATVTWSTLSAVLRLLLAVLFLLAFQNAGAAILGVFIALVITVIALWIQVKQSNYKSTHRPFNVASVSVIGITILFAWLTNIDIVYVRADLSGTEAGNYAVAASIIKATLIGHSDSHSLIISFW
jgi:O-antigen/teichoic acid export membrane protein